MDGSLFDILVNTPQGTEKPLSTYAGKVLLIVNVASYCGYTPQYAGLEKLYKTYQAQGLLVLGFPCNDYGNQEPGTNEAIAQFCTRNYGATFELFDKVHARGAKQHPLYAYLTSAANPDGEVLWNFEKFLVSRQGMVVGRYSSSVSPDSPQLVAAIETELAKPSANG